MAKQLRGLWGTASPYFSQAWKHCVFFVMNSKTYIKRQVWLLLVVVVLLTAYFGFTVALQVLQQHNLDAVSRREAVTRAEIANYQKAVPSSAAQRHWRRAWTCPLGVSLTGAPAAWSNGWVATAERGRIVALDNSGRLLWNQSRSNVNFAGSPVVAGTTAIAAGRDGDVLAMDLSTGGLRWQVQVDASCRHGPLAVRCGDAWQVVLLSSDDGVLRTLDVASGRVLAQSQPTNESDGEPATDGRILAYGNCDAAMHIFGLTNGESLATVDVGPGLGTTDRKAMPSGVMAGGVLVRDGRIYGGTGGGELVCVDLTGSNVAWRVPVSDNEAFNTPVAAGTRILMSNRDGDVMAFDAASGTEAWRVSLSNVVKTLCVVDDAVFTVAGGALVGLRSRDGGIFLKMAIGDDVDGPVWNGRILLVAADGGNVIGFSGE